MADVVLVSPHLDDAALSCSGGITRLTRAGVSTEVVTAFTADQRLGEPLSPLASRAHAAWGVGDQPFAVRRVEDIAALQLLGVKVSHLGLLDAMYRRAESGVAFYTYFHSVPAADDVEHCLPRLTAALRDSAATTDSDTLVFCPAGTGSHVDHVLTRRAVEQLVDAERIIYYDEYPYSARPAASSTPEDVPDSWVQYKLALSAEETELQVAAIGCYASQLRGLFPSGAERLREIASARVPLIGRWFVRPPNVHASRRRMAARVIRDTSHLGGERYWLSPQCASPFPKS